MIRIELTRTILMLRFSNRGFVAIYAGYKPYHRYTFQFIHIALMNGDEIVRPCNRHSIQTVTDRQHVTKYKNMRKWMVEFLRKVENHAIEIGRDNLILITKIYQFIAIYFNFVWCWGSVVMLKSLN